MTEGMIARRQLLAARLLSLFIHQHLPQRTCIPTRSSITASPLQIATKMPTREVVDHFEACSVDAKGEGPLQEITTEAPQSLITKHECLAARPNAQPCPHHYDNGRLQPDQDRVQSTGARTPFSLAAEIEAQVAATKARRESEAKDREKTEGEAKAKY